MLKSILNLEGAQQLSKSEQNSIQGGWLSVGLGEFRCPGMHGAMCIIPGSNPVECTPCNL